MTLLDGQRVVGANVTGVPDISQFPQLLIKRVDVVTGGASASYGSDAVGGVVNFITDKRFEGVKGRPRAASRPMVTTASFWWALAAGHSLFDDRLHVEGSVEYDHENGVGPGGFGETSGRWPRLVPSHDVAQYQYHSTTACRSMSIRTTRNRPPIPSGV